MLPDEPWLPFSGWALDGSEGWPDHTWPGRSWSVGNHLVRTVASDGSSTIEREADRLHWLASEPGAFGPGPGPVVDGGWIVVDVGAASPAHRPEAQPEPDAVPAIVAEALRRLHDLDVASCPYRRSRDDVVSELAAAIDQGRLRADRLREPYDRYEPVRLLELVAETRPSDDDLVVAHGAPVLSNLMVVAEEPTRFVGVHRLGVGDRHLDLAVITHQLQLAFGPEALYGFYEAYGQDPDLLQLDHYVLLDAMTAAVDPITVGS